MNWPAYTEYIESSVSWLGAIPAHWATPHLGHITDCLDAVRIPLNASERAEVPGDVPYWGANGVVGSVDRPLVDGELVLLGEDGAPFTDRTREKAFFVNEPIWPNNHIHVLRPSSGLLPKFLTHALNATDYSWFIEGSTREKLTQGNMSSIPIALPPTAEQRAIVDFLDLETVKIDALISKQEQLIATLREDRAATITQAVTKGLDPNVDMKPSTLPGLDEIPHHWKVVPLKHVVRNVGVGLVINPSSYVADSGVPFLLGRNIRDGWIDLTDVNYMSEEDSHRLKASRLQAGDVVVVRAGYPGRAAVVSDELEGANCASILILREPTLTQPEFLASFLNSSLGRAQVKLAQYGAAQEQINVGDVVNFVMPVPPLSEQQEISERVSLQTAAIDALITKSTKMIETLREYRSALITDAVTGKIDVRGVA